MTSRPAYVLIVDADANRIDAALRGCGDVCQLPNVVARTCGDAIHMLEQLGPPVVLMIALALPDEDSLSVIESLGRIDGEAAVIAWAADRDVREYVASRLAKRKAKILGGVVSRELYCRCVGALLRPGQIKKVATPSEMRECDEDWQDVAESARQRLCVVGAAAYTKSRGAAEYTMSVSWSPDAPMPAFPAMLSSAVEEVLSRGVARVWTDLGDHQTAGDVAVRALAIVPIRRDRNIIGALCAFDVAPHALREQDLDVLSTIAAGSMPHRGLPPVPIDRDAADTIIQRELARTGRDPQPLTVMLFAMTAQTTDELPRFDDVLASLVRGNDLVVRWTSSQVVVVLPGVDNRVAERVAGRISEIVETKTSPGAAVSRAVTEVGTAESLEDTIARAAATMRSSASVVPSAAVPRLPVPSRGYRATPGSSRRRPPA